MYIDIHLYVHIYTYIYIHECPSVCIDFIIFERRAEMTGLNGLLAKHDGSKLQAYIRRFDHSATLNTLRIAHPI